MVRSDGVSALARSIGAYSAPDAAVAMLNAATTPKPTNNGFIEIPLLAHHRAAIDDDSLAGDEGAVVGCEEQQRPDEIRRDLLALERAGQPVGLRSFSRQVLIGDHALAHGQPRRNRIDADVVRAKLARKASGHRYHRAF